MIKNVFIYDQLISKIFEDAVMGEHDALILLTFFHYCQTYGCIFFVFACLHSFHLYCQTR